jgi:hypothetical protein
MISVPAAVLRALRLQAWISPKGWHGRVPRAIDDLGLTARSDAEGTTGGRANNRRPAGRHGTREWCYFTENVSPVVNRCTRGVDSSRWTKNVR